MNGGWRLESKLCSKLEIVTPPERIRPGDLKNTKFAKIKKGLWN
jgi:hypothetical protein